MISEAVDTVVTLGWALAVWILLTAAVVVAVLYALAAAVWGVCRAVAAVWRRGRGHTGLHGPHTGPDEHRALHAPVEPAQSRLRPQPAWARKDTA